MTILIVTVTSLSTLNNNGNVVDHRNLESRTVLAHENADVDDDADQENEDQAMDAKVARSDQVDINQDCNFLPRFAFWWDVTYSFTYTTELSLFSVFLSNKLFPTTYHHD